MLWDVTMTIVDPTPATPHVRYLQTGIHTGQGETRGQGLEEVVGTLGMGIEVSSIEVSVIEVSVIEVSAIEVLRRLGRLYGLASDRWALLTGVGVCIRGRGSKGRRAAGSRSPHTRAARHHCLHNHTMGKGSCESRGGAEAL